MKNNSLLVIPERIQLESVFGCNARCTMCPVHSQTDRKKGMMSLEMFHYIVDELEPYKEYIEKFDLWGEGEPTLDKNLCTKIRYLKNKGFSGVAIATNADLLNRELALNLLDAELDTVIFSIDGVTPETHEQIRINTRFDRVLENAERIVSLRNEGGYSTKFVFRFIKQECNKHEWDDFLEFWGARINKRLGDLIISYDIHTWGGEIKDIDVIQSELPSDISCHHLFDRVIVLCDGTVPMCCSDMHHAKYNFGNIKDASPLDIFNNKKANKFRSLHNSGKRLHLKICSECTILNSENAQKRN